MIYNGGDGKDIGKLEESGNGVLLEVADILLMVGERLEVVFERVQL